MRPLLLVLLLASVGVAQTPDGELAAALAHARTLPVTEASFVRYVSFYNLPEKDRADAEAALSFALNTVSRSSVIRTSRPVPGTTLMAFDLRSYKLPVEVWESIIGDEPYWHLKTEVLAGGKRQVVQTDGGWLNLDNAKALREHTGSAGALVRADWLVSRLLQPDVYYVAAGIPTTKAELFKQLGVDGAKIIELRANKGENVLISGITDKPRRLSRWQAPLGALWQTYDTAGTNPAFDPIRDPTFNGGFDAQEVIFARPNGMHGFVLFNGKGERQNEVPPNIAKDKADTHGDGRLVAGISCVRCHGPDGGLKPFAKDQSDLFAKGAKVVSQDPQTIEQVESFYDPHRLGVHLDRDVEDYGAAVRRATGGQTVKSTSGVVGSMYDGFVNFPVTPETAQAELGVASLEPLAASSDGVLLSLRSGKSITRKAWEASWPTAALLVRSVVARQPASR